MPDEIAQTKEALKEAEELAFQIIADIELSRVPLSTPALKASRLARLLGRYDEEKMFLYEASGYPTSKSGIPPEVWKLAVLAGRTYESENPKTKKVETFAYVESVAEIEAMIESSKLGLQVSQDASSSAPPTSPATMYATSFNWTQTGNALERKNLREQIVDYTKRFAARRFQIYRFTSSIYYEIRYSYIAQDIFSDYRKLVESKIGNIIPEAIKKFSAIHENLRSTNPEDWSNSAHGCRRVLQDLADTLFPPTKECREVEVKGKKINVKLGKDNYINRLVCFVQDRSESKNYKAIIGSHLNYFGERLDAIAAACQKGTHDDVKREEANRIVIFTYLLVGDILSIV